MITEITLEFREALSILMNIADVELNRLSGGKFKGSNNLSKNIQVILENGYGYVFTNQADEGLVTLPFFKWDSVNSKYVAQDNFNTILNFLFREYGDSYCIASPYMEDAELIRSATLFLDSFLSIMMQTYDKYNMLIESYKTQEAHLLDGVKITNHYDNVSKYKDTPQGAVSIEDLGDNYNSNVTIGENEGISEDMRGTPIERLIELEGYRKILEAWAKEFQGLFWEV